MIDVLLGVDEFSFAVTPLVVEGCVMIYECHPNTYPVGVATQGPVLCRKFSGRSRYVAGCFFFVTEEVREIMAQLGIRASSELTGHVDPPDTEASIEHWKVRGLDFACIFYQPVEKKDEPCCQVDV